MGEYQLKFSGVEWLGDIPKHWTSDRLRDKIVINKNALNASTDKNYAIQYIDISNVNSQGIVDTKDIKLLTFETAPSRAKRIIQKFDTIISSVRTNLQAVAFIELEDNNLIGSTGFFVCRPKFEEQIISKFLYFFLLTEYSKDYFFAHSVGVSYPAIDDYKFGSITIPLPKKKEQKAIVDYLDKACQQIDKTIEIKQQQLQIVSNQLESKIIEVIRCGLNPKVQLKQSYSDWLGMVPEHWKVKRVKRITEIIRGKFSHRPRNDPMFYDGDYPFIQTGDVTNSDKYIKSYSQTLNDRGYAVSKEFPSGTLTMTIAANVGDVAILDFDACFPDSILGFKPLHMISVEYLYYMFLGLRQSFLSTAIVTTQLNLNIVRVGATKCAIPPIPEQNEIIKYLDNLKDKTDVIVSNINSQIKTLIEYRKSLIHECVTGKKRIYFEEDQ